MSSSDEAEDKAFKEAVAPVHQNAFSNGRIIQMDSTNKNNDECKKDSKRERLKPRTDWNESEEFSLKPEVKAFAARKLAERLDRYLIEEDTKKTKVNVKNQKQLGIKLFSDSPELIENVSEFPEKPLKQRKPDLLSHRKHKVKRKSKEKRTSKSESTSSEDEELFRQAAVPIGNFTK